MKGHEFDSPLNETSDVYNLYFSLPSLALAIIRTGTGVINIRTRRDVEYRNQVMVLRA